METSLLEHLHYRASRLDGGWPRHQTHLLPQRAQWSFRLTTNGVSSGSYLCSSLVICLNVREAEFPPVVHNNLSVRTYREFGPALGPVA